MSFGKNVASDNGLLQVATQLRNRFKALWDRCLVPNVANRSEAVWVVIAAHYDEPHRFYHDKQHLAYCLEQLDSARDQIDQPDAVEMALWFHDVINDPGHSDNEERSAAFFRHWADGVMNVDFITTVADLILATTHRAAVTEHDQQFICDIDLASFGCHWECYKRDTDNIKAEFTGSQEEYYAGKRAFLGAMLRRPSIFQTDFFRARYEHRARDNIRRLVGLFDQRQD